MSLKERDQFLDSNSRIFNGKTLNQKLTVLGLRIRLLLKLKLDIKAKGHAYNGNHAAI
jgi:hypothetical protein